MVLYRPEVFEPLTDRPWDGGRARDAIAGIVADADAAYSQDTLWPADDWDAWGSPVPLKSLYAGGAGALWALDALRRAGHAESSLDLVAASRRVLELWCAEPDLPTDIELPSQAASSLFTGEGGVLLVAHSLEPDDGFAQALLARVRANVRNESWEVMWGSGGTMLAAQAMFEQTAEERWRDAWLESAEELWAARGAEGLWTGRLFGMERRSLTPPHGLVGNAGALLRWKELLDEERRAALERDTARVLAETAVRADGLANWPTRHGAELVGPDGEIRVQWCGGAPGIVIAAADYLDEELLLAGAELAWKCGPPGLEKGPSICHGTAGNGYAFLKAWRRTGDERWLARARRFAVHALGQVERLRETRGRGRYTLITGDLGVALFAAACLDERADYPVTDAWNW